MQTITFTVLDMHCVSCPKIIKLTLADLDGVKTAEADLNSKTVTVEFDPQTVNSSQLEEAIKELGYTPAATQ